ncbi:MAG: hypothetical protein ABTQ25_15145 [Nitrosomonas ureae]
MSYLREPDLYLALRFEEDFLWGKDWLSEEKSGFNIIKSQVNDLVNLWMLDYPAAADICRGVYQTKQEKQENSKKKQIKEKHYKIKQKLTHRLEEIWISAMWNREQRRHYHALWGLQQLKRKIFRDKLFLCKFALRLNIHKCSLKKDSNLKEKPKLLVVRAAVLRNLAQYILLLRDFQNAFNKSMDTGVQDHLRPSIERRRELGIYMDFLSDRTRDIFRDMTLLLIHLGAKKEYSRTRIIYHRWRHHFTSTTEHLNIDHSSESPTEKYIPSSIRFVNTSYYMPERPDLQPVIAHEVAHALLQDRIDNFDGISIAANNDQFSDLIARIQRALSDFDGSVGISRQNITVIDLSREIACDLLAASVKGYSYVYSLFLELAGIETERLLIGRSSNRIIDLYNIDEIDGGSPIATLSRHGLLRIKITISWLRKCHHLPQGKLGSLLLIGMDYVLDELNDYLNSLIINAIDKNRGLMWGILINRLCEIVGASEACNSVQNWREKRSSDDIIFPKEEFQEEKKIKGSRELPRSMARLNKDVRNRLFYTQFNKKMIPPRGRLALNNISDSTPYIASEMFTKYYGVISLDKRYAYSDEKKEASTLFRHLYDLSWQASLMRAMDMLGGLDEQLDYHLQPPSPEQIIWELHNEFPLGRAFFSYALEFYSWSSEPAIHRLRRAFDVVKYEIIKILGNQENDDSDSKNKLDKLLTELNEWLGVNSIDPERIREILSESSEFNRDISPERANPTRNYSAYELLYSYQNVNPIESKTYRSIERMAGYKLQVLCDKLQENEKIKQHYYEFVKYLSIRSTNLLETEDGKKYTEKQKFIDTLTASLANSSPNHIEKEKLITVILSRIAIYNLYPFYHTDEKHGKIRDMLKTERPEESLMWPVLGRYDIVMIEEARPIHRSCLPFFEINKESGANEFFPPFFARQEMALFGCFRKIFHSTKDYFDSYEPIAFCAITLQGRQYRLDFLYRLICSNMYESPGRDNIQLLSKVANEAIQETDAYFLTDGWGDLVILFSTTPKTALNNKRLQEIFDFQNIISQDFMVDRVDLLLTPTAFNCAIVENIINKNLGKPLEWEISLQVRLIEERIVNLGKEKFKRDFFSSLSNQEHSNILNYVDLELSAPPGKADLIIKLSFKEKMDNFEGSLKNLRNKAFQDILKFIPSIYLDRIDTIITKNIEHFGTGQ